MKLTKQQKADRMCYLKGIIEELRSEIKQRIAQRDSFATQFILGFGAVVTLSLADFQYSFFLIWLLPFLTIFYSLQILYSYYIHENITQFLRKHLEPQLASLLDIKQGIMHDYFWETRCAFDRDIAKIRFPGIRKSFFEKILFVVPFISTALFALIAKFKTGEQNTPLIQDEYIVFIAVIGFLFFEGFAIFLVKRFHRKNELEILGKRAYICNKQKSNYDKAVFLDRDGTIIIDKVQPKNPDEIAFFEDTFEALKMLQEKGYLLILVTNQSGIKQEKLTEKEFLEFTNVMLQKLKDHGIHISAVYYSPHERKENHISFKPNPGMLLLASEDFNLNMENSYFIGDQYTDYIAGSRAGVQSLYVETGIYRESEATERTAFFKEYKPKKYASLLEAIQDIE